MARRGSRWRSSRTRFRYDSETSETHEPSDRSFDLLVDATGCVGHLKYFASAIVARVGHALDAEVACPPIALGVFAECQNSVESRAHLPAEFDDDIAVAQIVLAVRLRVVRRVESQTLQIGPKRAEVDVRRRSIQNRSFLGQDVAESVVKLLKLGRGRLDAAAVPTNPYATVVAQGLESPLARHLHPMHPAVRLFLSADTSLHRCTAARLQKRRQAFPDLVRMLLDSLDITGVGNAQDDHTPSGIRERAYRLADRGQVPQAAFELRPRSFSLFNSPTYFQPFHIQNLGERTPNSTPDKCQARPVVRASTTRAGTSTFENSLALMLGPMSAHAGSHSGSIEPACGQARRISMRPQPYAFAPPNPLTMAGNMVPGSLTVRIPSKSRVEYNIDRFDPVREMRC